MVGGHEAAGGLYGKLHSSVEIEHPSSFSARFLHVGPGPEIHVARSLGHLWICRIQVLIDQVY